MRPRIGYLSGLLALPVALCLCLPASGFADEAGQPARPNQTEEAAESGRFLHEVLGRSEVHRETLLKMFRATRRLPNWVRNMVAMPRYVSGASMAVVVDGTSMELFGACLAGQCPQNHMRLLFSPDGKTALMRIEDAQMGEILLGEPSAQALAELSRPGL